MLAGPSYLRDALREQGAVVPPGHLFRLYFSGWWVPEYDHRRIDDEKRRKRPNEAKIKKLQAHCAETPPFGELDDDVKREFLFRTVGVKTGLTRFVEWTPRASLALCSQLEKRAEDLHSVAGPGTFRLDARSTAPFVTGMGMEHPLENGFAFLDPYGVPYLPGSSVKGVLRRAAEELALFEEDSKDWTLPAVWWLFGFDGSSAFFQEDKKKDGQFVDPEPIRAERARWREAYDLFASRIADTTPHHAHDSSAERGAQSAPAPPRSADFSPHEDDPTPLLLQAFHRLVDPEGNIAGNARDFLNRLQEDRAARNAVHTRGCLSFWDVIPVPGEGDAANLRVDIMNPHYSHYYQQPKQSKTEEQPKRIEPPHDAGSPKPIFYLTVPPGWSFTFRVRLLPTAALPPWFTGPAGHGRPRWQALLEAAFQHAFHWLGFGAKTSLGYGGMRVDQEAKRREEEERERKQAEAERKRLEDEERRRQEEEQRRREAMTPLERALEDLEQVDHEGFIELFRQLDSFEAGEQKTLAEALKTWMQEHEKWKVKKKERKKWERVARIKEILGEGS